nr:hypothetical protein [Microbispora sp. GKU 823]
MVQTSTGRGPRTSATAPSTGPAAVGAQKQKEARPARLSEPVSDFTQMPATRDMAMVPKPETTTALR